MTTPAIEVSAEVAVIVRSVPCAPSPYETTLLASGYLRIKRSTENAHRQAYLDSGRTLAEGEQVDHLCHNLDRTCLGGDGCPHRACCEPLHLQGVPKGVNVLRGMSPPARNARREVCAEGHPLIPNPSRPERRYCPICRDGSRVARGEISAKGRKADRTHCPQGHEYTAENTYIATRPDGSFKSRHCKRCAANRMAERRRRAA